MAVRRVRLAYQARSKYRAVPTTVDGIRFHSAKEARRYKELKLLEKAGKIHDLRLQPTFSLAAWHDDHSRAPIVGEYRGDFEYCACLKTPCGRSLLVVEDVKGMKTLPLARWKQKHLRAQYGIIVREIR